MGKDLGHFVKGFVLREEKAGVVTLTRVETSEPKTRAGRREDGTKTVLWLASGVKQASGSPLILGTPGHFGG